MVSMFITIPIPRRLKYGMVFTFHASADCKSSGAQAQQQLRLNNSSGALNNSSGSKMAEELSIIDTSGAQDEQQIRSS